MRFNNSLAQIYNPSYRERATFSKDCEKSPIADLRIIFTISILLSLISCSSTKSRQALNSYVASEVGNSRFAIVRQKVVGEQLVKTINSNRGTVNLPFSKEAMSLLLKQPDSSAVWKSSDFKRADFILLNEKEVWDARTIKKFEGSLFDVYYLSDPFYIKEEDVVLFYVKVKMFPVSTTREECVVIMKKKNGEWYAEDKIHQNAYVE